MIRTRSLCACLLALILPSGSAAALEAPDLSGDYRMEGKGFGPDDAACITFIMLLIVLVRGVPYIVCIGSPTSVIFVQT